VQVAKLGAQEEGAKNALGAVEQLDTFGEVEYDWVTTNGKAGKFMLFDIELTTKHIVYHYPIINGKQCTFDWPKPVLKTGVQFKRKVFTLERPFFKTISSMRCPSYAQQFSWAVRAGNLFIHKFGLVLLWLNVYNSLGAAVGPDAAAPCLYGKYAEMLKIHRNAYYGKDEKWGNTTNDMCTGLFDAEDKPGTYLLPIGPEGVCASLGVSKMGAKQCVMEQYAKSCDGDASTPTHPLLTGG
jgi:hypothetical protein